MDRVIASSSAPCSLTRFWTRLLKPILAVRSKECERVRLRLEFGDQYRILTSIVQRSHADFVAHVNERIVLEKNIADVCMETVAEIGRN